MNIVKFPSDEAVAEAVKNDEPMLALISFDGKNAIVSHIDDSVEHHILLEKTGHRGTEIDRYFRIVFDKSGADWTFVCPPDYKNIPYKQRRIEAFYKDGYSVIPDFLHRMGYIVGINIPTRYRRHFDIMNNDDTMI